MLTRILIPVVLLLAIPAMAADIPVEPHTHTYFSWEFWGYGSGTTRSEIFRNLGLALIAFVGLLFGVWRAWTAHRQAEASVNQAKVAQEGHITDRFTKAVEQLGSENVTVRIGGVYALKRIAQDSIVRDHISVMDVLTNFIRYSPYAKVQREALQDAEAYDEFQEASRNNRAIPANTPPPKYPRFIDCPDIIAAIETIQSRSPKQRNIEKNRNYVPSLKNADFSFLILNDVDLSKLDLNGAYLKYANVLGVNLSHVDLSHGEYQGIDLSDAVLSEIDMSESDLRSSNLSGAKLDNAHLNQTNFSNANLAGANFIGADLSNSILLNANFVGANLENANLSGADLSGADVREANLSNVNFQGARLRWTRVALSLVSYEDFMQHYGEEYTGLTREEFEQMKNASALSLAYTRTGQPPRNLEDGIEPPPERDED